MVVKSREELKEAFSNGKIPTEDDFKNLIDSSIHKTEDGFFDDKNGLSIAPNNVSKKMLSFCDNVNRKSVVWAVEANSSSENSFDLNLVDNQGKSRMTISDAGVGIGGTMNPECSLDVVGDMQSAGRRGTYKRGKVLGDGKWHVIIDSLTDCHAFEIVAKINKYGFGMHSIIHAIAVNAFNGSGQEINTTSAYYGSSKNKIELRWTGNDFNYCLEIRTHSSYEGEYYIEYYVTNLWW